ncbi:MAG: hypothetical protein FWG73_02725 [Planctomycetaceae bacterium]|nr:hypothetical protein [Planctomycetaceae bacterium]
MKKGLFCAVLMLAVSATANEPDLLEIVQKHDEQWEKINSIQTRFTQHFETTLISRSLPGGYWELDGNKSRFIARQLDCVANDQNGNPIPIEIVEDYFYDGEKTRFLAVPRDQYPLKEIRFCDYADLKDQGADAGIFSDGFYVRKMYWRFLLPRYFSVHTEDDSLSLLELVRKYPSRIGNVRKNASGDEIIEIVIEDDTDEHSHFGPWVKTVFINTSKGYSIDGYRSFTLTKGQPPVEIIAECTVKDYAKVGEEHWIPVEWSTIVHNGDPAVGIQTSTVLDEFRVNDTLDSRLNDFRFPNNFVVREPMKDGSRERVHIWGPENEPVRSFDGKMEFNHYYLSRCVFSEVRRGISALLAQ